MRLIDADALDAEMIRRSFEMYDKRIVWNGGLWIRYKIFEEAIRDAPTVDAIPVEWIHRWWDANYMYADVEIGDLLNDWIAERKDKDGE